MYTETVRNYLCFDLAKLIKETEYNRVTVSEFLRGQIYWKYWDWLNRKYIGLVDFRLDGGYATEESGSALDTFVNLIVDLCWKKETANKEKARSCLKFKKVKDCGILSRLYVTLQSDGTYRAGYCAGQDYDSEMRTIRKLLTEQY